MDFGVSAAALIVGVLVGLTGMGGGALMTPILVLVFGVPPLTAVSSDLVAAAVMKPVAGFVHARKGTVQWPLVRWLSVASVPAAFGGALGTGLLGNGEGVQRFLAIALGCGLLLGATGMFVVTHRPRAGDLARGEAVAVRRGRTLVIGGLVGLLVGVTSVGSGSLAIVALLWAYPRLTARRLVGTDVVQAIPMVAAAALGHLVAGNVHFGVTLSLMAGCVPGAWLGSRLSVSAPDRLIRCAIVVVLAVSGAKLLGANPQALGLTLVAAIAVVALPNLRRVRVRSV